MKTTVSVGITAESFLTEEYVAGLLETRMWSSHGSSIDEFIQEYLPAGLPENWQTDSVVTVALKAWLPIRYCYASEWLGVELTKNCVGHRQYLIHRCIRGDLTTVARCEAGSYDIGKYWSINKTLPYGATDNPDFPIEITVSGIVNHEDIDWVETMRSRMDFNNGDIEAEVQLFPEKYPTFIEVYHRNINHAL